VKKYKILYDSINTDTYYQETARFIKNPKSFDSSYELSNNYYGGVTLIKFYPKGKVSYFPSLIFPLSKNSLNPESGFMGYYGKKKTNGKILISLYLRGDGGGYTLTGNLTHNNDSIMLLRPDFEGRGHIYKPIKIPKEIKTNWLPDW